MQILSNDSLILDNLKIVILGTAGVLDLVYFLTYQRNLEISTHFL